MYIDSHCHLGFEQLGDCSENTHSFLKRSYDNNVKVILDIATEIKVFSKYLDFAKEVNSLKEMPHIYNAIGIHPLYINEDNIKLTLEDYEPYLKKYDNIIAIGEIGFDGYRDNTKFQIQRKSFEVHAEIALNKKLPIIVHTRSADVQTLDALNYYKQNNLVGIIHTFAGNKDFAKKLLDLGFYISFSGTLTYKNAIEIQEVAKYVPSDRILVETDAPYLTPVPHRGKINEPAYVKHTCDFLSNLRNEDYEKTQKYIEENFKILFNLN